MARCTCCCCTPEIRRLRKLVARSAILLSLSPSSSISLPLPRYRSRSWPQKTRCLNRNMARDFLRSSISIVLNLYVSIIRIFFFNCFLNSRERFVVWLVRFDLRKSVNLYWIEKSMIWICEKFYWLFILNFGSRCN